MAPIVKGHVKNRRDSGLSDKTWTLDVAQAIGNYGEMRRHKI